LLSRQGVPPQASYLFKHALVQDAAYGTLLRAPRRALHSRIAEALESQFAEMIASQPELLARHCTEAGLIEKAASLWGRAGQQSLARSALLEAEAQLNLFVIFGEPDLRVVKVDSDMIRVEIKGMDIFDPTSGEVRSSGGADLKNDVAAWFVDDDYNEESFFVRQAYFVGQDPYDSLKRALKAEIDETAWDEMNSTISRPFPKPESGRICVKVINHLGDEVQKVFAV